MIVEEGDDVADMFTMQTEVAKLVNQNESTMLRYYSVGLHLI